MFWVWLAFIAALFAMICALTIDIEARVDINRQGALTLIVSIDRIRLRRVFVFLFEDMHGWTFARDEKQQFSVALLVEQIRNFFALMRGIRRARRYMTRHMRVRKLALSARLGLGDAELTALACGLCMSLLYAVGGVVHRKPKMDIRPDFGDVKILCAFSCMVSVGIGHIMVAALLGALQYLKRSVKIWKRVPLGGIQ